MISPRANLELARPAGIPRKSNLPEKISDESMEPVRPGEMLVKLRSSAEMEKFISGVRKLGGQVLGNIPRLGAVRIAFDNEEQGATIRELVPESGSAEPNYLVFTPTPPDAAGDGGGGYLGFGREALSWLGVPEDNANWGEGIKVAVLDTGIYAVPGVGGIRQFDLVGGEIGAGDLPVHGTSVASILAGTSAEGRGVAPGAELLSYRVLDDTGVGDSFTVAQGILEAVDAGARVISMSIGSGGDSAVLREAINHALARNVAVVAAVGNEGVGSVSFPAHYPGVIAVTAVDANGQRGSFANYGNGVSLAAPGIGVLTPWRDASEVNFSGTSAAVPFVSGTLAMLFAENPSLTAAQAGRLLVQYANDAGAPGQDAYYGAGILDISRLLTRNQPGINDVAMADIYYNPKVAKPGSAALPVQVTVQNRGTTTLANLTLQVTNNGQTQRFLLSGLAAGSVSSQTIEVDPAALGSEAGVRLQSQVQINGVQDVNLGNNQRGVTLRLKAPVGE